ncbi:MAG: DUF1015 domain-containing protein [Oscillospiraceae bacterium]|nr:DUF1015 domain-containing protein [Oscillospiraceae bacterium]
MTVFKAADILLPQVDSMEAWSVIACDQFTSQPEYWEQVRKTVGTAPSTLNLILPESKLTADNRAWAAEINQTMAEYLKAELFKVYPASYIYVERTLLNGSIRSGVVGAVDLDAYDYSPDASSAIRATERTVVERIPPRKQVREGAPIELPHVLLLCDDARRQLIEPFADQKAQLPKVYDFDLMQGGGRITGWLVSGEAAAAFGRGLDGYAAYMAQGGSLLFAVGDGNHSLATAKACYDALKAENPGVELSNHPARYALVELGNIHEESLQFEAIHRVITNIDPKALLERMQADIAADDGIAVTWYAGAESGTLLLDRSQGATAVMILQSYLDRVLPEFPGAAIDYIHGDDTAASLGAKDASLAILLPAMGKNELFPGISADGVLPRKTFSMGHAQEKRYYLEARKIR